MWALKTVELEEAPTLKEVICRLENIVLSIWSSVLCVVLCDLTEDVGVAITRKRGARFEFRSADTPDAVTNFFLFSSFPLERCLHNTSSSFTTTLLAAL
jgi:hypothetical protein